MLRIKSDTLRSELDQIHQLVSDLKGRAEAGVPGDDLPANDLDQEIFQVQLRGEMMLAAQRLLALSEVLE